MRAARLRREIADGYCDVCGMAPPRPPAPPAPSANNAVVTTTAGGSVATATAAESGGPIEYVA